MNLILLLGVCAAVLFVTDRVAKQLNNRSSMSDQQIWDLFLKDEGYDRKKALYLWYEIADVMKVSPGLLRPDDRLADHEPKGGGELTPYLDSLVVRATKHAALLDLPPDLNKIITVQQYIRAFHNAVETGERME